jgi:hypothetical protein
MCRTSTGLMNATATSALMMPPCRQQRTAAILLFRLCTSVKTHNITPRVKHCDVLNDDEWSRDSSVSTVTTLRAERLRNRGSIPGRRNRFFLLPEVPTPRQVPVQPPVQCVPAPFRGNKVAGAFGWPLTCN